MRINKGGRLLPKSIWIWNLRACRKEDNSVTTVSWRLVIVHSECVFLMHILEKIFANQRNVSHALNHPRPNIFEYIFFHSFSSASFLSFYLIFFFSGFLFFSFYFTLIVTCNKYNGSGQFIEAKRMGEPLPASRQYVGLTAK